MYQRFADVYDALMDDVDYDAWGAYICALLNELGGGDGVGVGENLTVADAACGTGSLSLRLAEAGHRVTGIDISPDMLEIAAQKARRRGLSIPFVCQDIRSFALHRPVDAVVCACDGVNYLLEAHDVKAFFHAAYAALKPGGLLLFDISSRWKIERLLAGRTMGVDNADDALLWQNHYDAAARLLQMQLTFFARKGSGNAFERFRETHVQKAHEPAELGAWLAETGFTPLGEYACFTREAPDAHTERIQLVARKAPPPTDLRRETARH